MTKYRIQANKLPGWYFQHVARDLRADGLSIYRGLVLSLVRTALVNFAFYFSYAALTNVHWFGRGRFLLVRGFLQGITAGAVTQFTTLPIDLVLVRTCIESGNENLASIGNKKGTLEHCRQIFRDGGLGGFWAGLLPSLALTCNPGISMLLIERLRAVVGSGARCHP